MLSSIFIALLQAAAGDPAAPAQTQTPAAEAPAAQTDGAPRTERVRVCRTYEASTGGRLSQRRCRWEERPVRDEPPAADAGADAASETTTDGNADGARNTDAGGSPAAASPSAPSPQ